MLRCYGRMSNGKQEVLPIDYVCDFESIVKRTVARRYSEIIRLCQSLPQLIDRPTQVALGKAFERANLETDYAGLFFRARQARDPEESTGHPVTDDVDVDKLPQGYAPDDSLDGVFVDSSPAVDFFGE